MNGTSEEDAKGNLANLDLAYLISYAGFMFVSGWVAERMDLRYFLSGGWRFFVFAFELDFEGGMILGGVVTFFFGFAYTAGIHSFGYLIGMQVGWFYVDEEILNADFFYLCGNFNSLNPLKVLSGVFQSTGWPGVVTVVANWFGKGRK